MFGKSKPPASNALASRVRQLGERAPAPAFAEPPKPVRYEPEKPRSPRTPVFRNATAIFDTSGRMAVAIKDLSDHGARIEFVSRDGLPEEFTLSEPLHKFRRRVRIVWQIQGAAGVRFLD